MRLSITFCLIINLVASNSKPDYDSENVSAENSDEGPDYIPHTETTLDLRGKIRQLFVVEIGLDAKGQNKICSPISAMLPLAKLVLGSQPQSKTEKELLAALGMKKRLELRGEYQQTLKELKFLKGVEISLASRLYVSKKHRLQTKFKNSSINIFGSAIELINTNRKVAVANKINKWVAEHTKYKITKLISANEIDPDLSLIMVNAIYFKGSWKTPFKIASMKPFHSPAGEIHVPMMSVTGRFNYVESDDLNAKIIELPYVGEEAAMIIVLPNNKNGLPILLRALKVSHDLLHDALLRMKTTRVTVSIPKLRIETTVDLKSYYKKMGVIQALAPHMSDLSQIVQGQKVHISSAIQKAFIEVTEQGTEAAAASAMQIVPLSAIRPLQFTANYPFLFYIHALHEQLFAGVVNSP